VASRIQTNRTSELISLTERTTAHNYHPLPVVISEGEGAWVTDAAGRRYLDCLAAYSAVNFGHRNPEIIDAVRTQLDRITLTSRAFHHDLLGPFAAELAALAGKTHVLPMNTGAEAVETAIKAAPQPIARFWVGNISGAFRARPGHFKMMISQAISITTSQAEIFSRTTGRLGAIRIAEAQIAAYKPRIGSAKMNIKKPIPTTPAPPSRSICNSVMMAPRVFPKFHPRPGHIAAIVEESEGNRDA
jgi:hypothetical protein